MVELRLLGGMEIVNRAGERAGSVLQQPKRFALLAFVATEGPVARDRLLGIFWPELSESRARAALSQALHFIERSLGTVFNRDGALISLDDDVVRCDVVAFQSRIRQGDAAGAAHAYAGDFLPGFIPDTREVEAWVEQTRTTLRSQAAVASWEAAGAAAHSDPGDALFFARRSVELAADDEHRIREAMSLMHRLGDSAGALHAYETLRRRVADDFDAEPDTTTQALARRIRAETSAPRVLEQETVEHTTSGRETTSASYTTSGHATTSVSITTSSHEATTVANATSGHEATSVTNATSGHETSSPASPPAPVNVRWPRVQRFASAMRPVIASSLVASAVFAMWGWRERVPEPTVDTRVTLLIERVAGADSIADIATMRLAGALEADNAMRVIMLAPADVPMADTIAPLEGAASYLLRSSISSANGGLVLSAVLTNPATGDVLQELPVDVAVDGDLDGALRELTTQTARAARRAIGRRLAMGDAPAIDARSRTVLAARQDRVRADSLAVNGSPDAALALYQVARDELAASSAGDAAAVVLQAELAMGEAWVHLRERRHDSARKASTEARRLAATVAARRDLPPEAVAALQGMADYWWWMSASPTARQDSAAIFRQAIEQLTRGLGYAPTTSRAWAALASLHVMEGDFHRAYTAATRARVFDTYLRNEGSILGNLFDSALEVGDEGAAKHWCGEMTHRGATQWARSYCELLILAHSPTPATDSTRSAVLVAAAEEEVEGVAALQIRLIYGVVQARAGNRSAAVEALRATSGTDNPEVRHFRAWLLAELGDTAAASRELHAYISENPAARRGILMRRRFEAIRATFPLVTSN